MTFYRPDFQNVLLQNLPSTCSPYVKKRLMSYSTSNLGIKLLFEDKTTAIVDVLVGADGIKSSVRRNLLAREAQYFRQRGDTTKAKRIESSIDAVWSGIVAYRTVIPSDLLGKHHPDHPIFTQPTHVSSSPSLKSLSIDLFFLSSTLVEIYTLLPILSPRAV